MGRCEHGYSDYGYDWRGSLCPTCNPVDEEEVRQDERAKAEEEIAAWLAEEGKKTNSGGYLAQMGKLAEMIRDGEYK